eukprot:9764264-Ditylum_brightwellii.AAC.1
MRLSNVDPNIYVQDKDNGKIWARSQDFPRGDEFNEKFNLRQENYKEGRVSVFVYLKMVHMLALGTLKNHETIRLYIWKFNIWLHVDHFDTARVSEPGFIADIHPNLVNINRMSLDIANGLRRARANNEEI